MWGLGFWVLVFGFLVLGFGFRAQRPPLQELFAEQEEEKETCSKHDPLYP